MSGTESRYKVLWQMMVNAPVAQSAAMHCYTEYFPDTECEEFIVVHEDGTEVEVKIEDLLKRPAGAEDPSGLPLKLYNVKWSIYIDAKCAESAAVGCYLNYFPPSGCEDFVVTDASGVETAVSIGDLDLEEYV
jgi:hypothetical protein